MNRTFSVTVVLALMMLAVALCVKQTIEVRGSVAGATAAMLFSIEGISAGLLAASVLTILRKRFVRQKKRLSRRPIPVAV